MQEAQQRKLALLSKFGKFTMAFTNLIVNEYEDMIILFALAVSLWCARGIASHSLGFCQI